MSSWPLAYAGRLALGEIKTKDDPARAKQNLLELGREAHTRGLELVARKAAAIVQNQEVSVSHLPGTPSAI